MLGQHSTYEHIGNDTVKDRKWLELFVSDSRHVCGVAVPQWDRGGAVHLASQTPLTERTESFVPKTKTNLCQTNELKRPTWEVNTNEETLDKCAAVLVVGVYLKID